MKRIEFFEEDISKSIKMFILNILAPLRSQNIEKVSIKHILDVLKRIPEIKGIDLDNDIIIDTLNGLDFITKIEPDFDNNGELSVFFKLPQNSSKNKKDEDKKKIKKAAKRQLKKEIK